MAVSQKVEGIEPRNIPCWKDDIVRSMEVNTVNSATGKAVALLPRVGNHGMSDNMIRREPGRPGVSFGVMRVCRTTEEGGRQIKHRESDSLVVPIEAGNAAGGKG